MLKQIYNNNLKIRFKDQGNGPVIVLIHGFIETHEIWTGFDSELSKGFRVLSIDLPGHGLSDLHEEPYTMCKYAESVKAVLDHENIAKAFIIGHSMGGYVTMAFSEKFPDRLSGICLFHSSPFSDNEDKKKARNTTIENIRNGELKEICKTHVKSVYAAKNVLIFKSNIEHAERLALGINKESVIASIITMRDRNDRHNILSNIKFPFLFILGREDNFIPIDILQKVQLPEINKVVILENSGHMGMIEEKEKSLNAVNDFHNAFILNG